MDGNTFHPRLQEDGTLKSREEEAVAAAPDAATESATPAATEAAVQPQPDAVAEAATQIAFDPSRYFLIDRERPSQDIIRLAAEDHSFDRSVREYAGRKNRREWSTRVSELEAALAEKDRELAIFKLEQLPQEDVQRRLLEDPEFARGYADLMSESQDDDISTVRMQSYYQGQFEELVEEGLAAGIPEQRLKEFETAFVYCPVHRTNDHGFYDHDERGRMFDEMYDDGALVAQASWNHMQRYFRTEMAQTARSRGELAAIPPPVQAPQEQAQVAPPATEVVAPVVAPVVTAPITANAGAVNPALAGKSPDLAAGSVHSNGRPRYTGDQLREMDVEGRIALTTQFGGREKMLADGVLYVPGLSEKLGHTA